MPWAAKAPRSLRAAETWRCCAHKSLVVSVGYPPFYLPLVVSVEELDEMAVRTKISVRLHEKGFLVEILRDRYGDGSSTFRILKTMLESRRLILIMDGLDEAVNAGSVVTRYVTQTLVEMDLPMLLFTTEVGEAPYELQIRAVPGPSTRQQRWPGNGIIKAIDRRRQTNRHRKPSIAAGGPRH